MLSDMQSDAPSRRAASRGLDSRLALRLQPSYKLFRVESNHAFDLQVGDHAPAHPLINRNPGNPHTRGQFFRCDQVATGEELSQAGPWPGLVFSEF